MFKSYPWHDKLPQPLTDSKEETYEPHLKLFFETMCERQKIWKRRFIDKQERPWTEDKFFKNSKFTNVYRELDRNSQWLIKNVILDDTLSQVDIIWKIMLFRFFNEPATFELASGIKESVFITPKNWRNGIPSYSQYNEDEFADHIYEVRNSGQNPYTTAYLINSMATPGMPRDYCYTRKVIPELHKMIPHIHNLIIGRCGKITPDYFINELKKLPSVADFIAHEFYQDFTYIKRYTGNAWFPWDQNDYTNVGPGCSVGIRLIFPNLRGAKEQKQAIYWLRDMADDILSKSDFPFLGWSKDSKSYYTYNYLVEKQEISLHQIEMWLCEFQKYWKMQIGEGKQRSKFLPQTKGL